MGMLGYRWGRIRLLRVLGTERVGRGLLRGLRGTAERTQGHSYRYKAIEDTQGHSYRYKAIEDTQEGIARPREGVRYLCT